MLCIDVYCVGCELVGLCVLFGVLLLLLTRYGFVVFVVWVCCLFARVVCLFGCCTWLVLGVVGCDVLVVAV